MINYDYTDPAVPNTAGTGQWEQGDPFNNVQTSRLYWSSTTTASNTSFAWLPGMNTGHIWTFPKTKDDGSVWPVRGGQ